MFDRRSALAILAAGLAPAFPVLAQPSTGFPSRPVKLIVPYAPGGITDAAARLLGAKLQEKWGQSVLIDNRPGASGGIGADVASKSAPDGYTLMLAINSMLLAPILDTQLRFDLERDFAPVSLMGTSNYILVASNEMGVTSLKAFADAVKAAPKKYSYGSIGAGSAIHLYADQLARQLGADPVHVPFKGAAPLVTELLSGRIDFAVLDFLTTRPHIDAGKLKGLAVTGTQRSALFPAVPTFAESGYPGFDVSGWFALFAPKGAPAALLQTIAGEVALAMKQPDIVAKFAEVGAEVRTSSPDDMARRVANDKIAWQRLIVEAKLKPQ